MRRTLNEVQRICQKAAEGAGAPAGLDMDAAKGAAWLLAHDLPALAALADDLSRFADLAAACRFERSELQADAVVDAAGKSGAVMAPLLIDLLVARAARGGEPGRLRISGLTAPQFLLPPAVGHAGQGCQDQGWTFRLHLEGGMGQSCAFHVVEAGQVEIHSNGSDDIGALFEASSAWSLDAVCARSPDLLDDPSRTDLTLVKAADRLEAAYGRSLAEGVSLDPQAWARLQALAAKVLVPATEQSHLMGAGALASDNE